MKTISTPSLTDLTALKGLVTIAQASEALGQKTGTIYQWARRHSKLIKQKNENRGKGTSCLIDLEDAHGYFGPSKIPPVSVEHKAKESTERILQSHLPEEGVNPNEQTTPSVKEGAETMGAESPGSDSKPKTKKGPTLQSLKNQMRKTDHRDLTNLIIWICGRLLRGQNFSLEPERGKSMTP